MNILLIFFAIPLAVIILSAILESLINCPFKVAGIFFAIFIVGTVYSFKKKKATVYAVFLHIYLYDQTILQHL